MTPPTSITGAGAVSCVGIGADALWQAAFSGRSGLQGGLGRISDVDMSHLRELNSASRFYSSYLQMRQNRPSSQPVDLAFYAINEALNEAGIKELRSDDGLILASTTGQIPVWDRALVQFLKHQMSETEFRECFKHQPIGSLLSSLTQALNFNGRSTLVSSACSAATQAIALGDLWLRQGLVKRVFVGGVEVLCDLTIQGFRSLQLLSSEPTRPFDKNRNGINLAEGAAFLVLENSMSKKTLGQISGHGLTSDAHHMTAPDPEGQGSFRAMKKALNMAQVEANEISWVHAHGTGSVQNDLAESVALRALFSEGSAPIVSSTKWTHGHALGASGVIESVLCLRALKENIILPTGGLLEADPKVHLELSKENISKPLNHILKNTLGFGGANAAVIFSRGTK